jgi:hypothetical protein
MTLVSRARHTETMSALEIVLLMWPGIALALCVIEVLRGDTRR